MKNAIHLYDTIKYSYLLALWILPFGGRCLPFADEGVEEIPFRCEVYAIEKDENGMMWIGTRCGLRIFNGHEYEDLEHELNTIPIVCLSADPINKVIWVGSKNGLYAVDYHSGDIRKAYAKEGTVRGILKRKSGVLFVMYSDGTLLSMHPDDGLPTTTLVPEMADHENHPLFHRMMVEDELGLFFFDNERVYLHTTSGHVQKMALGQGIETGLIPTYLARHEDIVIMRSWGKGILLLDRKTLRDITPRWMDHLNKAHGTGYVQCFLKGDLLYVYYPHTGIWVLNLKTGEYNEVWEENYRFAMWEQENSFFVGQDGTLWMGLKTGLLKIPNHQARFECLLEDFPGLPVKPSMREVIEDSNGDLYMGSYQGLLHYRRETAEWQVFSSFEAPMSKESAISGGLLNDVDSDYLYIVSEGVPFYRFNKKKNVFETGFYTLMADSSFAKNLHLHCLLKDRNGKIWIGGAKGLMSYDPQTQELKPENGGRFAIGNFSVTYMKQSIDGNIIWLCTSGGLFRLDITKGITQKFDTQSRPALSEDAIFVVDEDKYGNLWIGTRGGGIDIIDQTRTHVRNINTRNSSLCNDVVYSLLWENEHTVWFGTQRGLSRYDTYQDMFRNYFVEDGLCHNEFNRNSFFKDSHGIMHFGGVAGITAFNPHTVAEASTRVALFVSRVEAWNGRDHSKKRYSPASSGKIVMEPDDQSLTFSLGLSDYTRPKEHIYYYRIIGLRDDEWTSIGNQHILRLESLPYGNWTVELKAVNARGIPSDNIPGYTVIVKQPFYKTDWFFVLLNLAGVTLIYGVFWFRFQHLRKLAEQKVQIASDLHDEIGSIVTGIARHASLLNKTTLTEEEKQVKVNTIINASRSLSVSIRDVLWSIDARNDTAGNLAGYMLERTQDILSRMGIALRFYTSDVDEKLTISTSTRQHIYRIFKEAVNNALKHSAVTCITVTYSHRATGFCLIVENDGLLPPNEVTKTHSGQGLKNIEMRAKKLKAIAKFIRLPDKFKVIVASSNKFHQLTD